MTLPTPTMIGPGGVEIKLNQRWEQNDSNFRRIVRVIGLDQERQRVRIKSKNATWASVERFNGGHGGYRLLPDETGKRGKASKRKSVQAGSAECRPNFVAMWGDPEVGA